MVLPVRSKRGKDEGLWASKLGRRVSRDGRQRTSALSSDLIMPRPLAAALDQTASPKTIYRHLIRAAKRHPDSHVACVIISLCFESVGC